MRHFFRPTLILIGLLALGGAPVTTAAPDSDISGQDVTDVLERIRQDVGSYEAQAAEWRLAGHDPAKFDAAGKPLPLVCPTADMDFEISRIEVSMEVFSSHIKNGGVSLQVPLAIKIGPEIKVSDQDDATQRLKFDRFYHPDGRTALLTPELAAAQYLSALHARQPVTPISDMLVALRRSMIAAAQREPCFSSTDQQGRSDDHVDLEFIVTKDGNASVGFNLLLVSANAELATKRHAVHSIKVVFEPSARAS